MFQQLDYFVIIQMHFCIAIEQLRMNEHKTSLISYQYAIIIPGWEPNEDRALKTISHLMFALTIFR